MLGRKYPRKHTSSQNKALVKLSERFRSLLIKDFTGNGSSWKDYSVNIWDNNTRDKVENYQVQHDTKLEGNNNSDKNIVSKLSYIVNTSTRSYTKQL